LYAMGGNFVIEIEGDIAVCRMWSRPDVDREEGARFVLAEVDAIKRLLAESPDTVASAVLDMTRAPAQWGTVTQSCLERMVAMFESAGRRVAVVVAADPLQSQQMEHIIGAFAPRQGKLFGSVDDAKAWALRRPSSPPASSDDGARHG
jgi:hypothetical protein